MTEKSHNRSGRRGEYPMELEVREEMKFMLSSQAIQAEVTGIDQQQQNGVAERAHKTIYDRDDFVRIGMVSLLHC